ncbi:MAG: hypothetical protein H6R23_1443, partial [Proteobacteria bacterium]|nr:hypothetical protein [Pseudomonadota bacterium]
KGGGFKKQTLTPGPSPAGRGEFLSGKATISLE